MVPAIGESFSPLYLVRPRVKPQPAISGDNKDESESYADIRFTSTRPRPATVVASVPGRPHLPLSAPGHNLSLARATPNNERVKTSADAIVASGPGPGRNARGRDRLQGPETSLLNAR